jgi:hypothetical protein
MMHFTSNFDESQFDQSWCLKKRLDLSNDLIWLNNCMNLKELKSASKIFPQTLAGVDRGQADPGARTIIRARDFAH